MIGMVELPAAPLAEPSVTCRSPIVHVVTAAVAVDVAVGVGEALVALGVGLADVGAGAGVRPWATSIQITAARRIATTIESTTIATVRPRDPPPEDPDVFGSPG